MLTKQEEDFIVYWAKQRDTYRQSFVEFVKGMSVGLGISAAIIVVVITGWFERANMVANSKMSAIVFALALLIITVFMAWLYRNFQWENKEQQYLELLAKRDRSKPATEQPPL
jgi:cobalamin synthase